MSQARPPTSHIVSEFLLSTSSLRCFGFGDPAQRKSASFGLCPHDTSALHRCPGWEAGPPHNRAAAISLRWQSAMQGAHKCPGTVPRSSRPLLRSGCPKDALPQTWAQNRGPGRRLHPPSLSCHSSRTLPTRTSVLCLKTACERAVMNSTNTHEAPAWFWDCSGVWGTAVTRTRAAWAERGHNLPGGLLHPWHSVLLFCHFFSSLYLHLINPYHVGST